MIRPVRVDKQSPFLGEDCALCKAPFAPGEEVVVCPEDGSRHHTHCWQANGNKCAAYGCRGTGAIAGTTPQVVTPSNRRSRRKVRTLPSTNFGCARNCLYLSIAFSLIIATSCFGLFKLTEYILSLFQTPPDPAAIGLLLTSLLF